MSAYAALVSVLRILESIDEDSGQQIMHLVSKLGSFHSKVVMALDFLETRKISPELETRMRWAAYEAEDALELFVSRRLHTQSTRRGEYCYISFFVLAIALALMFCSSMSGVIIVYAIIVITMSIYSPIDLVMDYYTMPEIGLLNQVLEGFHAIEEEVADINDAGDPNASTHAALIYLKQILDSILHSSGGQISCNRPHLESLRENVSFFHDFLGNTSADTILRSELEDMDTYIRHLVYRAKALVRTLLFPRRFDVDLNWRTHCLFYLVVFNFPSLPQLVWSFRYIDCQWIPPAVLIQPLVMFLVMLFCSFYCISHVMLNSFYAIIWPSIIKYEISEIRGLHQLVVDSNTLKANAIKMIKEPSEHVPPPCASRDWECIGKKVLVGLESDIVKIRELLAVNSSKRQLVSIVGMGGIGKTTLARVVYEDPYIVIHFDVRAWVTVTQQYSKRRILLCLLDSAQIVTDKDNNDEELAVHLYKYLTSRRYLIVLDDVWDTEILDFLSTYFPDNRNGSCVLITSRLSHVASYLDSDNPLHNMQCLKEDDSWSLLHAKVFGEEGCPLELESIGREIARKCGGLPLAILVIGGLLSKDNRKKIWIDIAENLNSNLKQIEEQFLEVLGLSYHHLPHHLRPCFLYMGAFPGESEVLVSKLISLWTAEGFLKPCKSKTLEMVAEDYLKDLVDRNLILVCKKSCNGKIRTCSIHDLLRHVSMLNAAKENFLHVEDSGDPYGYKLRLQQNNEFQRRVSVRVDAQSIIRCHHRVRSYLCIASKFLHEYYSSDIYLGHWYLRVLDLAVVHFSEFPDEIIELVHLRYLAIHCDDLLPPSISNLRNLETIVYHHCSFRVYPLLPRVIWSMLNLRHLYVKAGCFILNDIGYRLPWKSVVLEHLQTLVGITNLKWTKGIIRRIPNLKKLGISYDVSSSVDWSRYNLECIVDLHQLESLKIAIKYYDVVSPILDGPPKLGFPQKLKKLSLSGSGIPWASIGPLPNLEALKLRREACSGSSWETVEEQFPQLVFLLLEKISFTRWETEASHFPRLKRLVIRSCGMLEEIPSSIGEIPTLEVIELEGCLPSAVASAEQIQGEQESMGNEDLKLCISL